MSTKSSTILENIKKEYEYTIDPLDLINTSLIKYYYLHGHFKCVLIKYNIDGKIQQVKNYMHNKKDKIDKNVFESFEKTLDKILNDYEAIMKKVSFDWNEITDTLMPIIDDYKKNIDKPEAKDAYINISKDIINKEINVYIKYQKKLILDNEIIIDIYKHLTN